MTKYGARCQSEAAVKTECKEAWEFSSCLFSVQNDFQQP